MLRALRKWGCAIALSTCCALSAQAQNGPENPLLKRAEAEQKIIADRLTGEMRQAINDAARMQGTSRIKAINILKAAIVKLEDPLVPAKFRNEWTANLNASIARIDKGENAVPPVLAVDPVKREMKEAQRARAKAILEERDAVRKSLDKIQALARGGRNDLAQEEANELTKKFPDNPAALVMAENVAMNQRIADAKVMVAQQSEGYMMAMRNVDKSATMPLGDIEFDKQLWLKITKARSGPKLTAKEQAILKALDTPIDANYKDAPFDDVLKSISKAMNQNILLDKQALLTAMVDSSTPTSLSGRGMSARTALRKILQDHQLTFIIRDQSIQVVTLETARSTMVTRAYYLGDIVQGVGALSGFGGASLNFGPWADMMQTQDNVAKLIQMIKGSLDPDSWKENGGNGSVTFHWPSMSLIIRQTSEVHSMLGKSLGSGQ